MDFDQAVCRQRSSATGSPYSYVVSARTGSFFSPLSISASALGLLEPYYANIHCFQSSSNFFFSLPFPSPDIVITVRCDGEDVGWTTLPIDDGTEPAPALQWYPVISNKNAEVGRLLICFTKCVEEEKEVYRKKAKMNRSIKALVGRTSKKVEAKKEKEYRAIFEAFQTSITRQIQLPGHAAEDQCHLVDVITLLQEQYGRDLFCSMFKPKDPPMILLKSKADTLALVLKAALRHANSDEDYEIVLKIQNLSQQYYTPDQTDGDTFIHQRLQTHEAFCEPKLWENVFFTRYRSRTRGPTTSQMDKLMSEKNASKLGVELILRIAAHQQAAGMSVAQTQTFISSISSAYSITPEDQQLLRELRESQSSLWLLCSEFGLDGYERSYGKEQASTKQRLEDAFKSPTPLLSHQNNERSLKAATPIRVQQDGNWSLYRRGDAHYFHNEETNETTSMTPDGWTRPQGDLNEEDEAKTQTDEPALVAPMMIEKPSYLPGETQLKSLSRVFIQHDLPMVDEKVVADVLRKGGTLYVTNYRVIFVSLATESNRNPKLKLYREMPVGTINKIERDKHSISIVSRNFPERTLRFGGDADPALYEDLYQTIKKVAFPGAVHDCFAFSSQEMVATQNGWKLYDVEEEFKRMGALDADSEWTLSKINEDFQFSPTYPAYLLLPANMSKESLEKVKNFRSKARIPTLVYQYKYKDENGEDKKSSMLRCAQPLVGLTANRCKADEKMMEDCNVKVILDARPKRNAIANKAKGGGYEDCQNHSSSGRYSCSIDFRGIENIHAMRESLRKVMDLCSTEVDDSYFEKLSNTDWLKHVRGVLRGADRGASLMQNGQSINIHCSDGWDRTPQLTAMIQILLDPFYRTRKGLAVVIEKEWTSFGHKFTQRLGIAAKDHTDSERSPVFLQFLDCVWQLTQQFPISFEFNESYLEAIARDMTSNRFGTFLHNNERERAADDTRRCTQSIWTYLLGKSRYVNPLYTKTNRRLLPDLHLRSIKLWPYYYRRFNEDVSPQDFIIQRAAEVIWQKQAEANTRAQWLQSKLEDLRVKAKIPGPRPPPRPPKEPKRKPQNTGPLSLLVPPPRFQTNTEERKNSTQFLHSKSFVIGEMEEQNLGYQSQFTDEEFGGFSDHVIRRRTTDIARTRSYSSNDFVYGAGRNRMISVYHPSVSMSSMAQTGISQEELLEQTSSLMSS